MNHQQPLHHQNVIQLPLPGVDRLPSRTERKGWSYLLADSLAFQKDVDYGIRIQKPAEEKVPEWICKLITSGQCRTIYVEDLHLPIKAKVMIEQLCDQYAVSLVGLSKNDASVTNVVKGPW